MKNNKIDKRFHTRIFNAYKYNTLYMKTKLMANKYLITRYNLFARLEVAVVNLRKRQTCHQVTKPIDTEEKCIASRYKRKNYANAAGNDYIIRPLRKT